MLLLYIKEQFTGPSLAACHCNVAGNHNIRRSIQLIQHLRRRHDSILRGTVLTIMLPLLDFPMFTG